MAVSITFSVTVISFQKHSNPEHISQHKALNNLASKLVLKYMY